MILDIALGILEAIFVNAFFDVDFSLKLVFFGIIFALLPDIDVSWGWLLKEKQWWRRGVWGHREFTHYPLTHVLVTLIIYQVFGGSWTLLYLLGTLGHLIHDSVDGWGIKWLWPFTKHPYRFFYRGAIISKADWKEVGHGHTGDVKSWLKDIYLRKYLPYEILALLIVMVFLYFYAK